jgi:hypothetical protein
MIDPKDFLKAKEQEEIPGIKVSGTFVCQECTEPTDSAILDEDKMILVYTCSLNHVNEAKL